MKSLPLGKGLIKRRHVFVFAVVFCVALFSWRLFCPGAVSISYTMPQNGELTLGLYGKDGKLLRWVVQDEFRKAGGQIESWDGLDQYGVPVPAGDYMLKAVFHAPLSVAYKATVGNPGTPPWPTPDGKGDWLCDEANPQSAVTDGKWVFLGSPGCEKGYSVIGVDEKGQRQWGLNTEHLHPLCLTLALAGDYLYVLYSGPEAPDADHHPGKDVFGRAVLLCLDKHTGKPAKFSTKNLFTRVLTWPYHGQVSWMWDLRNNHAFTPAREGGQPRYACLDVCESTNAIGFAAAGNKLYVSLVEDNKLVVLDPDTAKPTGEEIPVPAPAGLRAIDDSHLLAVSGTGVVAIDCVTKKVTPLITSGLSAPDDVTTDKQGNVYVSDWGSSFQVKVFDSQGRFLRAIGKEGGRAWVGKWDAEGMLVPRGIAVTDAGKLWVAEDDGSPCRISVWDAGNGAFIRDYIGPTNYGGGTYFWIDPHDPTEVNALGTRFKVDYDRNTYKPEAVTFRRRNRDDPFTPNGHNLQDCQVRILYRDGKEYAFVNTQRNLISILQRQGDIYQPAAALGSTPYSKHTMLESDGTGQTDWDSDVGYKNYEGFFPDCFRGHGGDSYTWTDVNGDGLVHPDGMHWTATIRSVYQRGQQAVLSSNWGTDIAPDWTVFFSERFKDCTVIFRVAPKSWTPAGAPLYDLADAKPIVFDVPDTDIFGFHVTLDGKLIVCYNFESPHCTDSVRCYDFDGHEIWATAMPKRLAGKAFHANNAIYDFQIPKLGDVVCAWLYHGSLRPNLITSDGLYVGTMLDETALAESLHFMGIPTGSYVCSSLDTEPTGPTALWTESAKYYYQTPDGEPWIINGGNQQEHILRIRGLEKDSVGRFETGYHLSPGDARSASIMGR